MSVNIGDDLTVTRKAKVLINYWEYPNQKNKENAVVQYVKESEKFIKVFVCFSSAVMIASSAATGAAIGCVVGAGVGTLVEPGLGTRVGMYAGGAVGGIAGGVAGTMMAKRTIMVIIPRTKYFSKWKREALRDNIYPLFEKLLKENIFSELVCPISAELPVVPVETPCHHIYEKEEIERWLNRRKEGERYCSMGCRTEFTVDDLLYSEEHLRKIMRAASARIRELRALNDENANHLANGLDSQIRDSSMASNRVFGTIVRDECQFALDRGMDEERYLETAKQLFRQERSLKQVQV